ncbi:permease-like cell division protein FtsX [Streptosporangium canum]|uniref:permease-like cell division protein FtsX n=1 Tax=Streptosporangium canum TaxID=324952 RepID=UPI00341D1D19
MNATENRLREALSAAAMTAADVRPLTVPARRRSRVPMLLVAAAVTAVAVGAGSVWAGWAGRADPRTTTAVQASPTPEIQLEISVFLCKKNNDPFPQCKGQKVDRAKIAEALLSRPDVEWIAFQTAAKAYKRFKEQNKSDTTLLSKIRVEDMPESFRIVPEQGADWKKITAAAKGLPGVSNVVDQRCLLHKQTC